MQNDAESFLLGKISEITAPLSIDDWREIVKLARAEPNHPIFRAGPGSGDTEGTEDSETSEESEKSEESENSEESEHKEGGSEGSEEKEHSEDSERSEDSESSEDSERSEESESSEDSEHGENDLIRRLDGIPSNVTEFGAIKKELHQILKIK